MQHTSAAIIGLYVGYQLDSHCYRYTATSYLPAFISLEVRLFGTLKEFLEADESVLILVHLLHHMFSHPVHLLVPFHHVILRSIRIIRFVQLTDTGPHQQYVHLSTQTRSDNTTHQVSKLNNNLQSAVMTKDTETKRELSSLCFIIIM